MKITSENLLIVIGASLGNEVSTMKQVVDSKMLELRSVTLEQAKVFRSILMNFFGELLDNFSKAYDHFVLGGKFFVMTKDGASSYGDCETKVYRRIAKILLATASDEEISSYAKKNKTSKKGPIAERDKYNKQFRKKKKEQ